MVDVGRSLLLVLGPSALPNPPDLRSVRSISGHDAYVVDVFVCLRESPEDDLPNVLVRHSCPEGVVDHEPSFPSRVLLFLELPTLPLQQALKVFRNIAALIVGQSSAGGEVAAVSRVRHEDLHAPNSKEGALVIVAIEGDEV